MTNGNRVFGVSDAKLCPRCGNLLRFYEVPGMILDTRHFFSEIVFWSVLALILAMLWSSTSTDERLLELVVLVTWLVWRRLPSSSNEAPAEDRRYFCEMCHAYVDDDEDGQHSGKSF